MGKIKQCFGRNEENRARRTIIKTIIKEFKRLTEVNLYIMTTDEMNKDIINEYLNHYIGPQKFSIYSKIIDKNTMNIWKIVQYIN